LGALIAFDLPGRSEGSG